MRVRVVLVTVALLVTSAATWSAQPSAAGARPVRAGTILGGVGLEMGGGQPWENPTLERSGCTYTAECSAWLRSGCAPALAGHDPALTASIVDVQSLAGGRARRTLRLSAPEVPPWGLWPGAVIQFWRPGCTEIKGTMQHTIGRDSACDWHPGMVCQSAPFRIPAGARWMTLSGYVTTVQLSWSLS